jgi:hypothetical protein
MINSHNGELIEIGLRWFPLTPARWGKDEL